MISDAILWLLPLLFIVHDAEEVLLLPGWIGRNRNRLSERFPSLFRRILPYLESISRRKFGLMAAEELLLLAGATWYAALSQNYYPWLALLLAFGIHLFIHLVQAVAVRGYVPSLGTSLLCLPVMGWMLAEIINSRIFTLREFLLCGVAGVVVVAANLLLIHALAARRAC